MSALALALCWPLLVAMAPADSTTALRRVLVFELQEFGSLPPDTARTVTGLVAAELARSPELFVVSSEEVDLIAQLGRDAPHCTDVPCLAEVAGALGVAYVVSGNVYALDPGTLVQLSLVDVRQAKVVSKAELRARTLEELSSLLPAALDILCEPLAIRKRDATPMPGLATTTTAGPATSGQQAAVASGARSVSGWLIAGLSAVGTGAMVGAAAVGLGLYAGSQLATEDVPRDAKDGWLWLGRVGMVGGLACGTLLFGAGSVFTLCSWME